MNKLDDAIGAQAIVYLPWNDTDGKNWRATWGAQIVGATTAPAPTVSLPEPVEEALQSLTQAVNLGTGLNHPSDKKHAERTTRSCVRKGIRLIQLRSADGLSGTAGRQVRPQTLKR